VAAADGESTAIPTEGIAMIRCHVMKGIVHIRDPEAMSPLHSRTLRAIAAHSDLRDVLEAFGVGRRVMQDVLVDLFYSGFVYLDVHGGRVVTSPEVSSAIGKQRLEDSISAEKPVEFEMVWVQEMVSGSVMAFPLVSRYLDRPPSADQARGLVPSPSRLPAIENMSTRLLAKAALPILKDRSPPGETVLDRVDRITDRKLVGSRTFFIPVRTLRPSPERPAMVVPDVEGFPQVVLDGWTDALNPRGDPSLLPSSAPDSVLSESHFPWVLAAEWRAAFDVLEQATKGKARQDLATNDVSEAIARLRTIAGRATELSEAARSMEGIGGPSPGHFEQLARLAERAREYILVGSAFGSERGMDHVVQILRPAISRGVKVLLLVGLPAQTGHVGSSELFPDIQQALRRVDTSLPSGTLPPLSVVSSLLPFHSKFAVADGESALVSSLNWLSAEPGGTVWEATLATQGLRLAQDILATAIPCVPRDNLFRSLLERNPELPPPTDESCAWATVADRLDALWGKAGRGGEDSPDRGPSRDEGQLRIEGASVADAVQNLRGASVVLDSEHRRILTSAIAGATKEVIISSDGLSEDGVGSVMGTLLEDAVKRGVKVVLRWGREVRSGNRTEGETPAQQRARELAKQLGDGLDVNPTPAGIHGKLLIVDGTFAVVSSFNFLSFGGVPGRERTLSGELGVAVSDSTVAQALRTSILGLSRNGSRGPIYR
jgi:hypothetical protein